MHRILVVDDDPATAAMLSRSLGRHGFQVDALNQAKEARERVQDTRYDGAVLDLVMPGEDGAALAAYLRQQTPGIPIAMLTGYLNSPLLEAFQGEGLAVFTKPVAVQDIAAFLKEQIG
jgi:CheY-like chemotaxis protein